MFTCSLHPDFCEIQTELMTVLCVIHNVENYLQSVILVITESKRKLSKNTFKLPLTNCELGFPYLICF